MANRRRWIPFPVSFPVWLADDVIRKRIVFWQFELSSVVGVETVCFIQLQESMGHLMSTPSQSNADRETNLISCAQFAGERQKHS
jgi:hypothetical protein